MAADPPAPPSPRRNRAGRSLRLRAPSAPVSLLYAVGLGAVLTAFLADPADLSRYAAWLLALYLVPTVGATVLTTPVADALGGRFPLRRGGLLALSALVLGAPLVPVAAAFDRILPSYSVPLDLVFLMTLGPMLWFRHLSLFGVSNPSHVRTLPASLVQPVLALVGFLAVGPWVAGWWGAALVFLVLGFATSVQLLRAADRPLRREFQTSGVALIRPMLDHINDRDPEATERVEAFFARSAILADLSVTVLEFRTAGRAKATMVLPTVHPGPFASLGASDLPRKIAERLGPDGGVVFVPHAPCNHELDLPNGAALEQVLSAVTTLRTRLGPATARAGPRVLGDPGALASAQVLGEATFVIVSQAPAPTDDIAFAVGDAIRQRSGGPGLGPVALADAHNSYIEDQGDIAYGTAVAGRLERDAEAAIAGARAAAVDAAPQVGVALRMGYSIRDDGIGPSGIRVLAVRAGARTSAYVLIDGNNLVQGYRAHLLASLAGLVDDAEVLTTDNHIVHEVDGSTNPVGERISKDRLAAEVRSLVVAAVRDLEPAEVRSGVADVREVPVLGPSWTERLLTSLGDTVSVFGHQAASTLLLLLAASTVLLVALR